MDWMTEFGIEAGAGLVGVFAGVLLALWTERVRRRQEAEQQRSRSRHTLGDIRGLIVSSVVRNISAAKRILSSADDDPYLFGSSFDLASWEATRSQFFALASADERILFTRFFDQVDRLAHLVAFNREVRAKVELKGTSDEGDAHLLTRLAFRLAEVAEDVRLEGFVLVMDHGESVHKRLLGIPKNAAEG